MRIEITLKDKMMYVYQFSSSWYSIRMSNYRNHKSYDSLILINTEEALLNNNDLLQFITDIKSLDKSLIDQVALFDNKVYSYQEETYQISEIFELEKEQEVFNSLKNLLLFNNIEFEYIKNDPYHQIFHNGLFLLFNFIDNIGENDENNIDIN